MKQLMSVLVMHFALNLILWRLCLYVKQVLSSESSLLLF